MRDSFDYVIVGGGSAGCVLAGRLSEDRQASVLLLEAGGRDWSPFIQIPAGLKWLDAKYDWCLPGEPDSSRDGFVDTWAEGRVLGGSSSINAMQWARGHRLDFDQWAELGCEGWDYESVLPYFRRTETFAGGADHFRGGDGPLHVSPMRVGHRLTDAFVDAAIEAGHPFNPDYNGERLDGVGRGQLSQRRGWRDSSARAFLAPARRRRNLTVRTRSVALGVEILDGRAVGVRYRRNGQVRVGRAGREVIVCAGTTLTPALLMRSGIGPGADLGTLGIPVVADVPEVGRNLAEHPYGAMSFAVNVRTLNQELTAGFIVKHGLDFLIRGKGPVTSTAGHALVFGHLDDHDPRPDYQVIFAPFGFRSKKASAVDDDGGETAYQALARRREHYHHDIHDMQLAKTSAVTAYPSVLHPHGLGSVTLRTANPDDPPLIRHELVGDSRDRDALMNACRAVREIFASPSIARYVVCEELPGPHVQTDDEWREYLTGFSFRGNHPVGTCRMGADASSVVDPQLRVRGVEGLRVVDASVMPTVTSAPTNAPTFMIAERGADLIRRDRFGAPRN